METQFPKKIGILGGGQLARMLAIQCYSLGFIPYIFCKSKTDSAAQVAGELFHDNGHLDSLLDFASRVDLVILENEFIDLEKLKSIEDKVRIWPSVSTLAMIQNKLEQKKNLNRFKIPTAPFIEVKSQGELQLALDNLGPKIVLKSAEMGYDGKGTFFLDTTKSNIKNFFKTNPYFSGYAEPFIFFKRELAIVVARSPQGKIQCFPVVETFQKAGICHWVCKPNLGAKLETAATKLAIQIIGSFKGVGVFAVEMFLLEKNKLVVNEIAPRVHNSGHITMDACNLSQFEQHLRAVSGLNLVKPSWIVSGAAMVNIIGETSQLDKGIKFDFLKMKAGDLIYLYGKRGYSLNRKLGHINTVGTVSNECLKRGLKLREALKI